MELSTLGGTGLKVSRLCLGSLMFGAPWNVDHDDCIRTIHQALDAGINMIDTGNVYSNGETEEIIGKAVRGRRDQVVIVTKFGLPVGSGPNDRGNGRGHILREVERSLKRLGTDYIDVYQAHRSDPDTPIEETLRALDDLIRAGKVRYIGTSRFAAWQLVESLWISDRKNLARFVVEEPPFSIFQRSIERDLLPVCARYGFGVTCFSPLNRGWLAVDQRGNGEVGAALRIGLGDRFADHPDSPAGRRKLSAVQHLLSLAREVNATLSQYALAWILSNSAITAPIIGPLRREHLEDNLGALDVQIPPEHFARVDRICPPETDL
jgi:aryl-alcohol dehydrogenase-like predicted oxidoreductase